MRIPGRRRGRHGRAHQHDHADLLLRDLAACCPATRRSRQIKDAIEATYGERGGELVVQKNFAAVDRALEHLHEVPLPATATSTVDCRPPCAGRMRRRSSRTSRP